MVDFAVASSSALQLDGSASPAVALWRLVGALTAEQAEMLALEIKLLAGAATPDRPSGGAGVRVAEGVRERHSSWCAVRQGGACGCLPRWEAWVYSRADRGKIRKTFAAYWEAKVWRHQQLELASLRRVRAPSRYTLVEAASLWVRMAREGQIRNRSGRRYKPSALRTIEADLRLHLVPALGTKVMAAVTRADLQRLVGSRLAAGLSASKTRSIVNAARVLWRDFDLLAAHDAPPLIDPTRGLRLPASTGRRERVASPEEARRLIEALPPHDRALWATAIYDGLRHGELRALQVRDIDLQRRRINVRRGWDAYEGEIDPKSETGNRPTIITMALQRLLRKHLQGTARKDTDLVFGRTPTKPFASSTVTKRARRAWAAARERENHQNTSPATDRIRPIGLQECRHTAVSQMLDAGITIDKVSKLMGHASITITIDRYGHLLPAGEADAIRLLDTYHQRHAHK
ncbi:MAG TPA: site-specific integrase [Solirubrobacteraceae bacterium]|nr:site-specific integrase [Solirubrobacteraceae bacterium]